MPAIPLTEAVKRVALVAERGSSVRLSFSHGKVTIEAGTEGQARARETVEADFTGEETAIAFSPHYLMDGLGAALIAATGAPGAADKPHAQAKAQGAEKAQEKAPRGKKAAAAKAQAEQADQAQNGDAGAPAPEQARICLQFTSPSKPALITGSAGDGDAAAPDYRYLVVPLRALASG
jgi:hypothetical protein